MGQLLILLVVALVAAALVFGVVTLISGGDQGLEPAEPDGVALPLPVSRPLTEVDLTAVRFDTAARGYRMAQVDQALRRAAYDLGYKEELINVLEAEVAALREGRADDAEELRKARESAARPPAPVDEPPEVAGPGAAASGDTASGDTTSGETASGDAAPEAAEADDSLDTDDSLGTHEPVPPGAAGDDLDGRRDSDEVSVASGPATGKADAQQ
jgi:DivIVA domain-containing protein